MSLLYSILKDYLRLLLKYYMLKLHPSLYMLPKAMCLRLYYACKQS